MTTYELHIKGVPFFKVHDLSQRVLNMVATAFESWGYTLVEMFHTGKFLFIEVVKFGSISWGALVYGILAILHWFQIPILLQQVSFLVFKFTNKIIESSPTLSNAVEAINNAVDSNVQGIIKDASEDIAFTGGSSDGLFGGGGIDIKLFSDKQVAGLAGFAGIAVVGLAFLVLSR